MEREVKLAIASVLNRHLYDSELQLESWRIDRLTEDIYENIWEYIKDYD